MEGWFACCVLVLTGLASGLASGLPGQTPELGGSRCPNPDIPASCTCESHPWGGPEIEMTCRGLENPGVLLKALKLNANVVRLNLVDCHMPYLPLGLAPHGLAQLHVTNGTLTSISPPMSDRSVFDGLTNLTTLVVKGVSDLSAWDWSKLKPLKNLRLIHVEDTRLPELPRSLSELGENYMWKLNVTNSHLLHVATGALASKTLGTFASRGNPLRTLRKDMHNSNRAIASLELIGTRITHLERNFLYELNGLTSLVTDAAFLSYMMSNYLYQNPQLHYFALVGEPPRCTCQYAFLLSNGLRWMEECVFRTSTQTNKYLLAEFLHNAC